MVFNISVVTGGSNESRQDPDIHHFFDGFSQRKTAVRLATVDDTREFPTMDGFIQRKVASSYDPSIDVITS